MIARLLVIAAAAVVLANCSTTPATRALATCGAYAGALNSLAAFRRANALTEEQIGEVDAVRKIVTPLCLAPAAPTTDRDAADKIEAGVLTLLEIEATARERRQ